MADTEPARYTLDEARREMDRQECARHGHTWDVISNGDGVPVAIICSRCDSRYNVTPMRDTP